MYKIMVVEDDAGIREALKKQLESWGMAVTCTEDFRMVIEDFSREAPHLVLLDVSLPYMNGYHWCSELRKRSRLPIVFISSAADNMNIVMAMNMGADDFVAKPFDSNVLVAKIQAILRRAYDFAESTPALTHRGAVLNTGEGSLSYQGQKIDLSKNEGRILTLLLQNKGKVVSREKLMEALWQTDDFVDENALTVNVGRLRKKLEAAGLVDFIKTKFGVGYYVAEEEKDETLF